MRLCNIVGLTLKSLRLRTYERGSHNHHMLLLCLPLDPVSLVHSPGKRNLTLHSLPSPSPQRLNSLQGFPRHSQLARHGAGGDEKLGVGEAVSSRQNHLTPHLGWYKYRYNYICASTPHPLPCQAAG